MTNVIGMSIFKYLTFLMSYVLANQLCTGLTRHCTLLQDFFKRANTQVSEIFSSIVFFRCQHKLSFSPINHVPCGAVHLTSIATL